MVEEYSYNRIIFTHGQRLPEETVPLLKEVAGEYADGRRIPAEEVPVYNKRHLSNGMMAIQQLSQVEDRVVVRGYLVSSEEKMSHRPTRWGALSFATGETEACPLTPELLEWMPLHQLLEECRLSLRAFVQLLCGCFDACSRESEVVLVALDEERADHKRIQEQLIRWVYHLLPYGLRRQADFTTFFDHVTAQGYTLGLVPQSRVVLEEGTLRVVAKHGYFRGDGYLFANNQVFHRTEKPEEAFDCSPQLYRRWLIGVVKRIYPLDGGQARQALEQIDRVYTRFDDRMACLPEEAGCDPRYYSGLCWNLFYRGKEDLTEEQEQEAFSGLLAFGDGPEVRSAVEEMLENLECAYESPAKDGMIELLVEMLQLGPSTPFFLRARELLCAFLSRDMEGAESGESSGVSARYVRVLTRAGLPRAMQMDLLERVFFPREFPLPPDIDDLGVWEGIGTSRSEKEGLRRCSDWVSGYANICNNGEDLIGCGGAVLRELDGMQPQRLESVLKSLLAAQEIRFHYARFEITPANLVDCYRGVLEAQRQPDAPYAKERENYGKLLLRQLSKDMMEYLSRTYTLTTVLRLNEAFVGQPVQDWVRQELYALTVTQCDFIVNYSWENLKLRFAQENQEILQRLWQVLALFQQIGAGQERREQICRQTCRYLIHAMPDYLNEGWVLEQVQELPGLDKCSYYQELLALRDFLDGEERDLEELQAVALRRRLSDPALQDLMKLIYRMYQQGRMQALSPLTLQGIYVATGEKMKLTQMEVFQCICDRAGLTAFGEMLDSWPSSPHPTGASRWKHRSAREGEYPWLQVDRSLMDTLERLSLDSGTLKRLAKQEPDALEKLMEAVNRLAPSGTVLRQYAIRVNRNLYKLWYQDQKMLKKVTSKSWKKRLLAE